jgi:hypothetical protein
VAGARRAWGGGWRGRMEDTFGSGCGRVCEPGKDGIGGRAREDGSRVRVAAGAHGVARVHVLG